MEGRLEKQTQITYTCLLSNPILTDNFYECEDWI